MPSNLYSNSKTKHSRIKLNLKLLLTLQAWCQKFSKLLFHPFNQDWNFLSFPNSYEVRIQISVALYHTIMPSDEGESERNFLTVNASSEWKSEFLIPGDAEDPQMEETLIHGSPGFSEEVDSRFLTLLWEFWYNNKKSAICFLTENWRFMHQSFYHLRIGGITRNLLFHWEVALNV